MPAPLRFLPKKTIVKKVFYIIYYSNIVVCAVQIANIEI